MKLDQLQLDLIRRYVDGVITAEEMQSLQVLLRTDASFRHFFARYANLDSALGDGRLVSSPVTVAAAVESKASLPKWLNWRPIAAAAAGIVLGTFGTSVVFAYAQNKLPLEWTNVLPLMDASFEYSEQVPAHGIPTQAGAWSGDHSRVVEAENGVIPFDGKKMLRFLRSDNLFSSKSGRSYVGEVAQVIDLRPLREKLSGSEQFVEVAARFNSIALPADAKYEFNVKAAAFRGDLAQARKYWEDSNESVSLSTNSIIADTNPDTWQRVTVPIVLPPDADFIVIDCAVVYKGPQNEPAVAEFPEHYTDHIELRVKSSHEEEKTLTQAN